MAKKGTIQQKYSAEFKIGVIMDMREHHMGYRETVRKYWDVSKGQEANYKNAVKGIDYSPVYLERFFRNLLLGERWDLRNRYLHIQAPEQVQDKYRTS